MSIASGSKCNGIGVQTWKLYSNLARQRSSLSVQLGMRKDIDVCPGLSGHCAILHTG